jgi:hypothetical protein
MRYSQRPKNNQCAKIECKIDWLKRCNTRFAFLPALFHVNFARADLIGPLDTQAHRVSPSSLQTLEQYAVPQSAVLDIPSNLLHANNVQFKVNVPSINILLTSRIRAVKCSENNAVHQLAFAEAFPS